MADFKCKICGGSLEAEEGVTVCVCENCGSMQTIPAERDEDLRALFNRANTARRRAEFEEAETVYTEILQKSPQEAEAYWGRLLCRFGVVYAEDPQTKKWVPSCSRKSRSTVEADEDFKSVLENADANRKALYKKEAQAINNVRIEEKVLSAEEQRIEELKKEYHEKYDAQIKTREEKADRLREVKREITEKLNSGNSMFTVFAIFGIICFIAGIGWFSAGGAVRGIIVTLIGAALVVAFIISKIRSNKAMTALKKEKTDLENALNSVKPIPGLNEYIKKNTAK